MKSNNAMNSNNINREQYFKIVRAGLTLGEISFSRDLILKWLIYFPGDLYASLLYAQILNEEKNFNQSVHVVKGILETDPEFLEAAELLLDSYLSQGREKLTKIDDDFIYQVANVVFALSGEVHNNFKPLQWGNNIRQARVYLTNKELTKAKEKIRAALIELPEHPLIMITHLECLDLNPNIALEKKIEIGREYRQKHPSSILNQILLSDWLMEYGEIDKAVAYLHEAATKDVGGQVPRRWWGENYLYKSIWPEKLELNLDIPIPGRVAALLGWNRLTVKENDFTGEQKYPQKDIQSTNKENKNQHFKDDSLLFLDDEIDEELLVLLGQEINLNANDSDDESQKKERKKQ